ncbi:MAG: hypothetical protein V4561_05610 [Bacteroidota bacterium]
MKKTILGLSTATFLCFALLTSCSSPSQKEENAKEEVQEKKEELVDAQQEATQAAVVAANAEEWQVFKNATQAKIDENQAVIAELRKRKRKASDEMTEDAYKIKIDEYQMANKQLRQRMDDYERNQSDWATFKGQFNRDLDQLSQSIKDMK